MFQDPRVREAIGLMFNFEWTNETLFYGLYQRTDSFFENSPMQAEGVPEGEELALLEEFRDRLPPEIFTEPAWSPPVGSKQQTDRAAVRRASRLLDEAGWTVGPDGMRRNAEGQTLTIALRRRQPGDGARHQPLRRQPAPHRHRRELHPDRRGADAAAPGGLRLRHPARPLRDVAQPVDRAAPALLLGGRRHARARPTSRGSRTRWSTRWSRR